MKKFIFLNYGNNEYIKKAKYLKIVILNNNLKKCLYISQFL